MKSPTILLILRLFSKHPVNRFALPGQTGVFEAYSFTVFLSDLRGPGVRGVQAAP